MEWSGNTFAPQRPAKSPSLTIYVELDCKHQGKFGKPLRHQPRSTPIIAIADSGCQTCTAGLDFLYRMGCTASDTVATNHRIVGITNSPLGIIGVLFVTLHLGTRESHQMVYISQNCRGLYLSQTAMKDLAIVDDGFPNHTRNCSIETSATCSCPPRTQTPRRPTTIPFPPTQANTPRLKEWLLSTFASSAFNTCPHQPLPIMLGKPVTVHFKPDATPHAVHTPIPVPHHWKEKVKADIDRDTRLGIIEPVPQGTITPWCARMVVTPKKNGDPRRTVDLQKLNKATSREVHHTPSPFNMVASVPTGKRKTVLDAWNGYHSLPLNDSSKDATTFITEWGRYRYRRAPMGFHTSGDAYTRRFDDITSNQYRTVRCIDDSLLWDNTIEEAFWHTFEYLKTCADGGIIFNKDKFQFAQETAEFAGFEITMDGYRPLRRLLDAVRNFPTPANITDVRSWFGLINQLAYTFAQAHVMAPFRELLTKKAFYWDSTMDEIFRTSKDEIVKLVQDGVKAFEPSRPTCLATDWSKNGIGFTLTQKHCACRPPHHPGCGDGHWKLVFAGSRFTKGSESRYAPIEGEALAVVFGLQRCRMFIMGAPNLILAVDHKPLIKILNDRSLDTISNPRLLQLKEKTLMYRYDICHMPGKSNTMKVADIASRNPVHTDCYDQSGICEMTATSHAIHRAGDINTVSWETINTEAATDQECRNLTDQIRTGFPTSREELPPELRSYWPMKEDLYVIENVPFKDHKMLIPKRLRKIVLEGLHSAHQGVNGMLSNARSRFFWPGLDAAVRLRRAQCRQCNEQAPSQAKEEPTPPPSPEVPFSQVAMDLCHLSGHLYLIYADRYSGWVEVAKLSNGTINNVRGALLAWFMIYGVPEEIATDGGPPFKSSEYANLLKDWDIRTRLSSAYFAQSNGRAEAAVKTAKRILLGNTNAVTGNLDTYEATKALLTHRNTPAQGTHISPAVALFGRPIRDHLPPHHLRREWQTIAGSRETALAKRHIASPITKQLNPLVIGDAVQLQNQTGNHPTKWHNTGIVTEVLPHRQYRVVVDGSRRVTLRNRKFLRRIDPFCRNIDTDLPTSNDNARPTRPTADQPPEKASPEHPDLSQNPPPLTGTPPGGRPQTTDRTNCPPIADGHTTDDSAPLQLTAPIANSPPPLRRSTRAKRAPRPLSPQMKGQSHDI